MSARLTALLLIVGLVVGGLVLQSIDDSPTGPAPVVVKAGVAIPAARAEPTLSSTWYCAAGTAKPGGFANQVLLIANPTNRARKATITALSGAIAPAPSSSTVTPGATTTSAKVTTTTAAAPVIPPPVSAVVDLPAQTRISFDMTTLVQAELASAIVEVDGGEVAVEHELTGDLGRVTAACSTTAASSWSVPWGVTERGARDLLVFMNPFPDDATVDIAFATDEGVRDTLRFQGFVVPGRSVVGAYVDQDVTRKTQVSAKVTVRGGRVVLDQIQTFDGTDAREGMTLSLAAPSPAEVWTFPDGLTGPGLTEQIVVFNPNAKKVAEIEVEVRLDDPDTNGIPEPFELSVGPGRFALLELDGQDRIPAGIAHSSLVHSLNGVGVTAERVVTAGDGSTRKGIGATLGSPIGSSTWYFPGGGTSAERDEYLTLLNLSDEKVTYDVIALANGQTLAIEGLQGLQLPPGGRASIRLGDHVARDDLPTVVAADGPIVVERGLYRVGGGGLSQAIGIPLARDVVVPDPING